MTLKSVEQTKDENKNTKTSNKNNNDQSSLS